MAASGPVHLTIAAPGAGPGAVAVIESLVLPVPPTMRHDLHAVASGISGCGLITAAWPRPARRVS
jgi:hypothetical protein